MDGIYLTWLISALAVGVFLMPYFKPPWAKLTLSGFVDFIRRYWLHLLIAIVIYNAKDWRENLDGREGMPSASDFRSAYKDDIIGKIKVNKKAFFKADVTNFKGINGLLGADIFGF